MTIALGTSKLSSRCACTQQRTLALRFSKRTVFARVLTSKLKRLKSDDGLCIVSLALKKNGELIGKPIISAPGCLDEKEDAELLAVLREDIVAYVEKGKGGGKKKSFEDGIRNLLRKTIRDELGKHPVLTILVHEC